MARALGVSTAADGLDGWAPVRVHERDDTTVEWCWLDGLDLDEPFFAETVERALRRPFGLLFRRETPIEGLDERAGLAPNCFVFHGSRCGSTLVSSMLASVSHHLVLSEPPVVDQVLRARAPEDERARWLRSIVAALGRPRHGERSYVLKLDAWSARSLGLVRRVFPDVPWIFLFRDPVEVLSSHFRRRGAHMVPGAIEPALFGLDPAEVAEMAPEEYCARVLAAIYRSALEHRDEQALFVDYRDLPEAFFERILPTSGLECSEAEIARMREVAGLDAKNPQLRFSPDGETKQRLASPALRAAAERWVQPLYEELRTC